MSFQKPREKEFLRERDLAAMTGLSRQTLSNWRHLQRGPCYVKVGHAVLYRRTDIERFFWERRVEPGNE